jgi:hypothetical protein
MWMDRLRGTNAVLNEAFEDAKPSDTAKQSDSDTTKTVPTKLTLTQADIDQLTKGANHIPTENDAVNAYMTLMKYIKHDFKNGVKFVLDFGKTFFGKDAKISADFNLNNLSTNYKNPLE